MPAGCVHPTKMDNESTTKRHRLGTGHAHTHKIHDGCRIYHSLWLPVSLLRRARLYRRRSGNIPSVFRQVSCLHSSGGCGYSHKNNKMIVSFRAIVHLSITEPALSSAVAVFHVCLPPRCRQHKPVDLAILPIKSTPPFSRQEGCRCLMSACCCCVPSCTPKIEDIPLSICTNVKCFR